MAKLRWGDDAPTGADEARRRLIAAADACIERLGLAKTTIEDVANEANVSRATIYRYFAGRDELILQVLLSELERTPDRDLSDRVAAVATPEQAAELVVDYAAALLERIRTTPKLRHLLTDEVGGVTATLAGASQALFRGHAAELGPHLEVARRRGLLRDDVPTEELAEWILRVLLSLLTVDGPVPRGPDEERRLLEAFLAPALVPAPAVVTTPG